MKLNGQPLSSSPASTTVLLPRPQGEPLTLRLQPLPLGFHRRLRERGLIPPAPPSRISRDAQGRPQRDTHGAVLTILDPHNPQYLCELEQYHQRVAVLSIAESLAADPTLQFDTPLPGPQATSLSWHSYADQLAQELEQAGFTAGDLLKLCDAICRLSNLLEGQLAEHTENFSSATPLNST